MWWNRTKQLNPKQEALIPAIRQKWRAIAFPPEPVNRQKAEEAVKAAYKLIGKKEPEIIFFDSPYAALKTILEQLVQQLDKQLVSRLENQLLSQIENELESELARQLVSQLAISLKKQLEKQLGSPLCSYLDSELHNLLDSQWVSRLDSQLKHRLEDQRLIQLVRQQEIQLNSQLVRHMVSQLNSRMQKPKAKKILTRLEKLLENQRSSQLVSRLGNLLGRPLFYSNCIHSELWASNGGWLDFCISILSGNHDPKKWQIFQSLVSNCGWIFPFENTCILCSRPIQLSFDSQHLLHAEGEYAILFADGYSLYFNHGVVLPIKYGQVHPHQWRAMWILEEENAELRRILIQEIGYERICQELNAIELDSWREYSLLKIDRLIDDVDGQPIYLIKMICPSTGFIHALRVPPYMQSARQAISWVNWGVDPEKFAVET